MFQKLIKYLLFLVALTPLVVFVHSLYPFIFPKVVFFRGLMALIAVLVGIFLLFKRKEAEELVKERVGFIKNPVFLLWALFFVSIIVSTLLANDSYRAFWGNMDRGSGLFTLLHVFAFFVLSLMFFSKKDWLVFFRVSMIVGAVAIFYGFLQFLGIKNFTFALDPKVRPGSYIGNPAFFASYLVLLIGQSLIVLSNSIKEKLRGWGIFSGILIAVSVFMIFLTATRGAIVGLGTGVLFLLLYFAFSRKFRDFRIRKVSLRKVSASLLAVLIAFSALFFATRSASLWQNVPGLNRVAETTISSGADASVQNRILTWSVSWEAFKEKPFFGWGPDNYITAYSEHYDPDYALYGETWLDKAHNIIFDVLVTQGLFGLASYLLLFGSVIYLLLKRKKFLDVFLTAVLIGYFIQNLFVFDQINSHIFFYALIGFLIYGSLGRPKEEAPGPGKTKGVLGIKGVALVILAVASLYYTLTPVPQAVKAANIIYFSISDIDGFTKELENVFYPYNYAQGDMRAYVFDHFYDNQPYVMGDPKFGEVADILEKGVNEILEREPDYDPRWYLRQAHFYEVKAKVDPKFYENVEESMKKAIEISPNRQEFYYNLVLGLAGQEKFDEAIEAAEKAIELSPDVARAHFFLGLAHSAAGNTDKVRKELEIARELRPDFSGFYDGDLRGFLTIYNALGDRKELSEFVVEMAEKRSYTAIQPEILNTALYYFLIQKNAGSFVIVAERIKEANPDMADGMDVLIDLALKEKWNILESITEFETPVTEVQDVQVE